ncbi:DNA-directed RNA polymerase subunit omega [Rhizobium bangladeshense]|uniref:DNA-directed RNA polymerase subunit omega n=1 Tax=Rhizobium bangladeshense TaxID=1138189 RepID=UPI001C83F98C|nr:DNA-directed RNA polymerase subunit omega [Rhizobium bangladeshense]MBX4871083.1 DNA-directed RNA polymerase subunit omega [Rhizobium bangladeshense]MBX4871383.1 DNA-directed RNA polymerase subunit omega [Rhizobium bangladeshense]MBX4887647.1 DNA-directed RNA polymerase subunit omega [Rhizobium bangladeshense]
MDPLIVFDCERVLANRFALAVAAAARSRSLNRGAEPRLEVPGVAASELALKEIAQNSFAQDELALFVIEPEEAKRLPSRQFEIQLRGGGSHAVAAPVSERKEAVH